ncbi:MAG: caspase family protein [Bacteroidia bacterium]
MLSLQGNVHALLIAIDAYSAPVPALAGCVNDSKDVQAWLETVVPEGKLNLKTLHDHDATKQNIIDGFLNHLGKAKSDDTVFIHYSGHGSQERAHPAFKRLEPDGLNETVVCVDSRQVIDGVLHRDLADKEVGALVKKVADTGAHVVMIFDCCHSGSGSRDTKKVTARQSPSDMNKPRTLEDYIFWDEATYGDGFKRAIEGSEEGFSILPQGKHILLAGARSRQTAKELALGDGRQGGIFTYSLLEVLKRSQGRVTYSDLVARARAIVNNTVSDQDPQLDVVGGADQDAYFMGGDGSAQIADHFMMRFRKDKNDWVIEAGALHGVSTGTGDEAAGFNVYREDAEVGEDPLMVATATKVEGAYCLVDFPGKDTVIGTQLTYKAKLIQTPAKRIRVRFEAEEADNASQQAALAGLKKALDIAPEDLNIPKAKEYVNLVEDGSPVDYRVYVYHHEGAERIAVYKDTDNTPLIGQLTGFKDNNYIGMANRLAAIARWNQTATLDNASTQINANDLSINIEARHRDPATGEWTTFEKMESADQMFDLPFYEYEPTGDESGGSPELRISVTNHNPNRTYYCSLYYMMSDFGVQSLFMEQKGENDVGKVEEVGGGQTVYAVYGFSITPNVDENLRKMGLKRDSSLIKLVASTVDFNARSMEQSGFGYPNTMRDTKDVSDALSSTINGITHRGGLRIRRRVKATDWTTKLVTLNSIHTDAGNDENMLAQAGVEVSRPDGTSFDVALASSTTGARNTDGMRIPVALQACSQPMTYIQGRSVSPNMDVIELRNVEHPEKVTAENPIRISFKQKLAEGETLLAVNEKDGILIPAIATRDGDVTTLEITTLSPEMQATGERSLGKTFKLLVHKIVAGITGKEFPYPKLSVIKIGADGKAEYEHDMDVVRAAMKDACDIVCLVHGFTSEVHESFIEATDGDPEGLLPYLYHHYDLVLGYDYETYGTAVHTNAEGLRTRLIEAEIRPGDQQLDLIVHSLGGLVSRYFIEKLGGKDMTRRLIMCGTPNGGSPLTNIKNAFFLGGTLLLNAIPVVGWGLSALGYIFGGLSSVNALDKASVAMKPNSDFLRSLNDGLEDPGVAYTILAGNTSKIVDEDKTKVSKILDKLGIGDPDYSSLLGLIFGGPNDIAVGTESIGSVPTNRTPAPKVIEVPSNHFGYFIPDGSLNELKAVIRNS